MMLKVDWGNYDDSLLVLKADQAISVHEMIDGLKQVYLMMGQQPHTVDTIVDARTLFCISDRVLDQLLVMLRYMPAASGIMVFIATDARFKDMITILSRVSSQQLIAVDTVDDAYITLGVAGDRRKFRVSGQSTISRIVPGFKIENDSAAR